MKLPHASTRRLLPLLLLAAAFAACRADPVPKTGGEAPPASAALSAGVEPVAQVDEISPFVRRIFEDSRGRLWFGTNGEGAVCLDGDTFRTYAEADGLPSRDVWCLHVDRAGRLWVGTLEGVARLDAGTFTPVALPEAEPDPSVGISSSRMVRAVFEDSRGRVWFATNGGATILEGGRVRKLTAADGLCDETVNDILEDRDGRIWFATHHGGVCRWDGQGFTSFGPADGVVGSEAWDLYADRAGRVWFPLENSGVYRFDGVRFTRFAAAQGLASLAIQNAYEDRQGRLWLGGWMGLFRVEGERVVAVGRGGPWD